MFEEVCLYRPMPGGESKVSAPGHRREGSKGAGGSDYKYGHK